MSDIFKSAVRSAGDLAGVLECDEDAAWFYLYDQLRDEGGILGAIQICAGSVDVGAPHLLVRWDETEERVGLFIRGELWAVFDARDGSRAGGNYLPGTMPSIPSGLSRGFGGTLQQ